VYEVNVVSLYLNQTHSIGGHGIYISVDLELGGMDRSIRSTKYKYEYLCGHNPVPSMDVQDGYDPGYLYVCKFIEITYEVGMTLLRSTYVSRLPLLFATILRSTDYSSCFRRAFVLKAWCGVHTCTARNYRCPK
jgi:hypothetical protein